MEKNGFEDEISRKECVKEQQGGIFYNSRGGFNPSLLLNDTEFYSDVILLSRC
jgi:hypothetical protein